MAIAITINERATTTMTQNIGSLVLICNARLVIADFSICDCQLFFVASQRLALRLNRQSAIGNRQFF